MRDAAADLRESYLTLKECLRKLKSKRNYSREDAEVELMLSRALRRVTERLVGTK